MGYSLINLNTGKSLDISTQNYRCHIYIALANGWKPAGTIYDEEQFKRFYGEEYLTFFDEKWDGGYFEIHGQTITHHDAINFANILRAYVMKEDDKYFKKLAIEFVDHFKNGATLIT